MKEEDKKEILNKSLCKRQSENNDKKKIKFDIVFNNGENDKYLKSENNSTPNNKSNSKPKLSEDIFSKVLSPFRMGN